MPDFSSSDHPQVTVLQHGSDVPLDRFVRTFPAARVVRLFAGDPVPSLEECGDGLIVLGGRMHAYDDAAAPWLPAVRDLLARAAVDGLPTLGICLGAQLLAVAGGGAVQVAAPPGREAGVVDVHWRAQALEDPVLAPLVRAAGATCADDVEAPGCVTPAVSMHSDAIIELPAGAQWLGWSDTYPYQAFRWGSALGVQFHPEASPSLAVRWALGEVDVDTAAVHADVTAHDDGLARTAGLLAGAFLEQMRAAVGRRAAPAVA
ncbi:type 1 glutamine amidotransferase [Isoptericola sp. G70]|uniref:type 1 glutamine amidotransferase n=1 Tax=Isoptericola sp. G70 TaxID=3376633 RepID=UPI003A80CA85